MHDALAELDEGLSLKPHAADLLNNRGNLRLKMNDSAGAKSDFESSIQFGEGPDAHNNLGNLLAMNKEWRDAIAHYRRAIELAPDFSSAHLNLANALVQTGDGEAAFTEYQTALALNPRSVAAHANFALLLLQNGQPRESYDQAQEALRLDPDCQSAKSIAQQAGAMLAPSPSQ